MQINQTSICYHFTFLSFYSLFVNSWLNLWWTLTKVKNKFIFKVSNILNLLFYDSVVITFVDNGAIDLVDVHVRMSGSG